MSEQLMICPKAEEKQMTLEEKLARMICSLNIDSEICEDRQMAREKVGRWFNSRCI